MRTPSHTVQQILHITVPYIPVLHTPVLHTPVLHTPILHAPVLHTPVLHTFTRTTSEYYSKSTHLCMPVQWGDVQPNSFTMITWKIYDYGGNSTYIHSNFRFFLAINIPLPHIFVIVAVFPTPLFPKTATLISLTTQLRGSRQSIPPERPCGSSNMIGRSGATITWHSRDRF